MMENSISNSAGKFVARVAKSFDGELKWLVFASPVSARIPDVDLLWHFKHVHKNKTRFILAALKMIVLATAKGLLRCFTKAKAFSFFSNLKKDQACLVLPYTAIKSVEQGIVKNPYIAMQADDPYFAFGLKSEEKQNAVDIPHILIREKIAIMFKLAISGCKSFVAGPVNYDNTLVFFFWSSWVLSFKWLDNIYLYRSLKSELLEKDIKSLVCVHEMHGYARILWGLCSELGIKTYAVQHASISSGKLWYFPTEEEINAGLVQPDVFFVYDKRTYNILKLCYNNTEFYYGCSSRYSHWKNIEQVKKSADALLLVGALASFDNDVLFKFVKTLLDRHSDLDILLRLHPYALLSKTQRKFYSQAEKQGKLKISKGRALQEDIADSAVVAGMSTTVLEEALMLSKPVIKLRTDEFLEYIDLAGLKGAFDKDVNDLQKIDFDDIKKSDVDSCSAKQRFGLELDELTFKKIID